HTSLPAASVRVNVPAFVALTVTVALVVAPVIEPLPMIDQSKVAPPAPVYVRPAACGQTSAAPVIVGVAGVVTMTLATAEVTLPQVLPTRTSYAPASVAEKLLFVASVMPTPSLRHWYASGAVPLAPTE